MRLLFSEAQLTKALRRIVMPFFQDITAKIENLNSLMDSVKSDITDLKNKLANIPTDGITAAEAQDILNGLTALESKLSGIEAEHTP